MSYFRGLFFRRSNDMKVSDDSERKKLKEYVQYLQFEYGNLLGELQYTAEENSQLRAEHNQLQIRYEKMHRDHTRQCARYEQLCDTLVYIYISISSFMFNDIR